MADVSPLYAATRRALLDALDALASQRDGLVLVGAQAIFLHTGDVDEAIATETKDADLALDPAALHADPLLETAMTSAGFHLDITNPQPGSWISRAGYPVDLLLPEAVSGRSGKGRAGRNPPHDNMSARRVLGIEGALVDHSQMRIAALTTDDVRAHTLKVADPAALLVAKQYKILERLARPARQRPRDSHDVYRLLREIEPEVFVAGFELMLGNEISAAVARDAIGHLETLFGEPGGPGAQQAAEAVAPLVEESEIVAIRCAALAREVLSAIA